MAAAPLYRRQLEVFIYFFERNGVYKIEVAIASES